MSTFVRRGRWALAFLLAGSMALACTSRLHAQAGQTAAPATASASVAATPAADHAENPHEYALRLWQAAKTKREADVRAVLGELPQGFDPLKGQAGELSKSLDQREADRAKKIAEVETKLGEKLAEKDNPKALSEALKQAVEMYMIVTDKAAFMHEPRILTLVDEAEKAARAAEQKQDWFLANELFYRLHLLMEENGRFKPDVERIGLRLAMMRMYVPEAFWKLRNDQRIEEGKAPLPPYNGLGESFQDRLKGIDKSIVMRAMWSASRMHIDSRTTQLKDLLVAATNDVLTMVTTPDLKAAFPSLGEESKRVLMSTFLESQIDRLNDPKTVVTASTLSDLIEDILDMNKKSVGLPDAALLHEFGNGAMSALDDFSSIIWPDEVARFDRMTSGVFRGVGVQIQVDDETQMIKVVSPLEGTPAQRAGVRKGDLIKKINGQSAVGITINQAVDLITGPEGSKVQVVMEREGQEVQFELTRAVIDQPSVNGWRRAGVREDDWDWFIDRTNQIGYVRLLGFSDNTTGELRDAVDAMKTSGLKGLIVDLRYNPGGLLTEAVGVANVFIDKGTIVSTTPPVPSNPMIGPGGAKGESKAATTGQALLAGVPVVVLINEGSASASEIVSGAIRHYADKGDIDAILIGQRSFGKGSVQNVWALRDDGKAKMRLTTQYYMLPDGQVIHRKPGASTWGVQPHMLVDMLPQQMTDAMRLRQDADVLPLDEEGLVVESKDHPEPEQLLSKGLDPQLQWALYLLQAKSVAGTAAKVDEDQQAVRTQ